MKEFRDKLIVVTGAGSGIGRALAVGFADRGGVLALSDIDQAGLDATARLVGGLGARVRCDSLDVRDFDACTSYAESIHSHFGRVNVLVNNAGITHLAEIEAMDVDDLRRVMDIDFWGVVNCTKAFLPSLISSGEGHVANMSSMSGFMAGAGLGAYNSAKFAVRGFTEALRIEMLMNRRPVGVTCVLPGGVKTPLVAHSLPDQPKVAEFFGRYLSPTTAEKAARRIISAIRRRRPRVLIGIDAHSLDVAIRLTGSAYQRVYAVGGRQIMPQIASDGRV